jgi:hypothetical protein
MNDHPLAASNTGSTEPEHLLLIEPADLLDCETSTAVPVRFGAIPAQTPTRRIPNGIEDSPLNDY